VFDHVAVFGTEGGGAGVQVDVVQTLIRGLHDQSPLLFRRD
jgi:hypothetical protein